MAGRQREKSKPIFGNLFRFSAVVAVFLFRGLLAAQTTGVEGTVRNAITHQPLDGVHVRLQRGAQAWGAITDHDGHFSISGMPPGRYGVSTQRNGFLYSDHPAFTLESGEHKNDFGFDLTPEAFISGRVTDENGDPVQNVSLKAFPVSTPARQMMVAVDRMTATTNERGEYRIDGVPGNYVPPSAAHSGHDSRGNSHRWNCTGHPHFDHLSPRRIAAKKRTVVEAVAGRETTGIDIQLVVHRFLRFVGHCHPNASHRLADHGLPARFIVAISDHQPKSAWHVRNCSSGRRLQVRASYMGTPGLMRPASRVPLHDGNVENITLNLVEGEEALRKSQSRRRRAGWKMDCPTHGTSLQRR